MGYELRGESYHCPRHAVTFGKSERCVACLTDPPPPPVAELDEPLPPPPKGCRSTEQLERLLNEDLDEARRLRRKIAKGKVKDLRAYNTIAKLFDACTKLARALAELAVQREDEQVVTARERRLRALRGGRN